MPPKPPQPPPVVRIPDENDPDIQAARRNAVSQEEENRKGRKSTNLSGPYTGTLMGGGAGR